MNKNKLSKVGKKSPRLSRRKKIVEETTPVTILLDKPQMGIELVRPKSKI
jgi:hypothetical protein